MRKIQNKKEGVILLLVVIILTAIFSISIGVFSVIIRQVAISETFESSNIAFYAADQSIERTLYRDRQENDFPCASFPCTTTIPQQSTASGGCMSISTITKIANPVPPPPMITQISVRGLNTLCGTVTERTVARAFLTTY
ncbi:MAG: hypothetical protein HY617_02495 [Candidatus Sungbacteria bacterium]|nr:hypothetical protein [Candidatus Sungbacteria bacterium]